MFDLGWTELLLIGIVALIVVGPKDLPGLFQALGQFTGRMRRMAREFSQAMNDAAAESGASDIQKTLRNATNPLNSAMDEVRKSTEGFTARTMAGPASKEGAKSAPGADTAKPAAEKATDSTAKAADSAASSKPAASKAAPKTPKAKKSKAPAKAARSAAKSAPADKDDPA